MNKMGEQKNTAKSEDTVYDFDKELEKLIEENESRTGAIKKIILDMESRLNENKKTKQ